ncbi:hypothetical protein B0H10DRAFT_1258728 [Mycena sp. CBHHK59/15]|nr:hypothetical protein B0H10DRAFT_1258728 [Mycena sp. CBHHK59/15]
MAIRRRRRTRQALSHRQADQGSGRRRQPVAAGRPAQDPDFDLKQARPRDGRPKPVDCMGEQRRVGVGVGVKHGRVGRAAREQVELCIRRAYAVRRKIAVLDAARTTPSALFVARRLSSCTRCTLRLEQTGRRWRTGDHWFADSRILEMVRITSRSCPHCAITVKSANIDARKIELLTVTRSLQIIASNSVAACTISSSAS